MSGRGARSEVSRSSVLNLVGQAAPMTVAFVAIPALTAGLGAERFGVLTLGWAIVGYLSLFDFGLSRALTQLVAARLSRGDQHELPTLAGSALVLMLALGVVGALTGVAATPWLVSRMVDNMPQLRTETLHAFYLFIISIPIVILTAGYRGILEGARRFDVINLIRVPLGVFTYVGPIVVLAFTYRLEAVAAALLGGRVVACAAHALAVRSVLPAMRVSLDRAHLQPLMGFGAWMTVTNVVGPIMVSLDRFLLGALISVAAVAYYTAPFEALTKLGIIPMALTSVLFPSFAARLSQDPPQAMRLYVRSIDVVFLAMFPASVVLMAGAEPLLQIWLGPVYAEQSASAVRWLAAGMLVNSLAQVPLALIQGAGRPDITAKVHLAELVPYLFVAVFAIRMFGVTGAAMAWTLRAAVDAALLFVLAGRLSFPAPDGVRKRVLITSVAGVVLLMLAIIQTTSLRWGVALVAIAATLPALWSVIGVEAIRILLGRDGMLRRADARIAK